ncbi:MAG TPA: hypothetical protein VKT32_16675, partial [Chthonomonadaceae bacterium]|nr:hypothetical protein [Chthonomonadaceae bacterium]
MQERRDFSGYDPVLRPYLATASEAEARQQLERLVVVADPVLHGVLRRELSCSAQAGQGDRREEVSAIVHARLLSLLARHRGDCQAKPIANFRAYVAAITSNAYKDHVLKEAGETPLLEAPDPSADLLRAAEMRLQLEPLWNEITCLNREQRCALLLNLSEIALFPALGVASLAEIAAVLEMPSETFAALWNGLPLSDDQIGQRLGCPRQRVINLRSSARQ